MPKTLKAACPYCARKFSVTAGESLPAHDAVGGRCDGADRRVTSMSAAGLARLGPARMAIEDDWKRKQRHDFRGSNEVCADCGLKRDAAVHMSVMSSLSPGASVEFTSPDGTVLRGRVVNGPIRGTYKIEKSQGGEVLVPEGKVRAMSMTMMARGGSCDSCSSARATREVTGKGSGRDGWYCDECADAIENHGASRADAYKYERAL